MNNNIKSIDSLGTNVKNIDPFKTQISNLIGIPIIGTIVIILIFSTRPHKKLKPRHFLFQHC